MSIASELQDLNNNILDAYTAVQGKGGTVPANKNMVNLPTAINSISGGGGTTVTSLYVTANGTYTAPAGTAYTPVEVAVPATVGDITPRLTSYDPVTGIFTGENLGASGKIYLLDRMQNKGVEVSVSSWSATSVELTTPIDTSTIQGTTSVWAVPTGEEATNKLIIDGDIALTGYGIVYHTSGSNSVIYADQISNQTQFDSLCASTSSTSATWSATVGSRTVYNSEIVGIQIGPDATSTPSYFLVACHNLNQPVDFNNVTSYGTNTLSYCEKLDHPVRLGTNATSVGGYFMSYCRSYNQPIDISGLTSISGYFMAYCTDFNQELTFSNSLTTIGTYFMEYCDAFNKPITITANATIGDDFLYSCSGFNQQVDVSGVSTIGKYFLAFCKQFNKPITFSSSGVTMGDYFLDGCTEFNQAIDMNDFNSFGKYFLYNCTSFNHPLDLTGVTTIPEYFMSGCTDFNQPLDCSNVTSISNYFLYNCESLNVPAIDVSSATSIGSYFMSNCYAFGGQVKLGPASYVGAYFMRDCYNISSVYVGNSSSNPTDQYSLSVGSKTCKAYNNTVMLIGSKAPTWKSALADRTGSSAPYRRLVSAY